MFLIYNIVMIIHLSPIYCISADDDDDVNEKNMLVYAHQIMFYCFISHKIDLVSHDNRWTIPMLIIIVGSTIFICYFRIYHIQILLQRQLLLYTTFISNYAFIANFNCFYLVQWAMIFCSFRYNLFKKMF